MAPGIEPFITNTDRMFVEAAALKNLIVGGEPIRMDQVAIFEKILIDADAMRRTSGVADSNLQAKEKLLEAIPAIETDSVIVPVPEGFNSAVMAATFLPILADSNIFQAGLVVPGLSFMEPRLDVRVKITAPDGQQFTGFAKFDARNLVATANAENIERYNTGSTSAERVPRVQLVSKKFMVEDWTVELVSIPGLRWEKFKNIVQPEGVPFRGWDAID